LQDERVIWWRGWTSGNGPQTLQAFWRGQDHSSSISVLLTSVPI
jgi:hypothetical protein